MQQSSQPMKSSQRGYKFWDELCVSLINKAGEYCCPGPDRKLGCEQQFLLVMMPLCLGLIWPILSGINWSDKLCRYNLDEDQRI